MSMTHFAKIDDIRDRSLAHYQADTWSAETNILDITQITLRSYNLLMGI